MFRSPHPGVLLETCLLKLGDSQHIELIPALVERVERLAAGGSAPAPAPPKPQPAPAPKPAAAPAAAPPAPAAPPPEEPAPQPEPPADVEPPEDVEPPPPPEPKTPEEKLKQSWPKVLDNLKEAGRQATAALMKETEPIRLQEGKLIVGIHSGFQFHKEHLEEFENRQLVEDALEAVVGKRYDIEFVSVGEKPTKKEETAITREKRPSLHDDPAIKKAIDILDAKIVSIKET
jgi:hypothetical protein